ncbi:hypothetical protein EDM68_00800 [Candidatus Uhrbacteria bacterium]|nr:MAG: hypothetical protein EDM68_00800 [Candidatus Uhrbacteria bacterium]
MNNRFGFYGVLGGIVLALLLNVLSGCASPAQAEQPRAPRVTVLETIEIIGDVERVSNEYTLTISDIRAVESVTYVTGEAHTYTTDDGITVDVEQGTVTIYN